MGSEHRDTTDSLTRRLTEEPYRFDFFRAVRLLECAHPERPRVGYSQTLTEDSVRFCQRASLAFAPCTIPEYHPTDESGAAARLYVNFVGLLGPNGPMPLPFTEYIRHRDYNEHDQMLSRFLDIFNHRAISFFYRAWACNQQAISFDRPADDRFAVYIGSLFGIGMGTLQDRDAVQDAAKLHYSGRLVCPTKHAGGLEALLEDYFRLPTRVREFIGRWIRIPPESCCRLGESPDSGSLGQTTVVGSRFYDCQQTFRIRFGPMGLKDYLRLLPGTRSTERLIAWVRNYVGLEFAWEAQLVLKADEVPPIELGKGAQLGWTTWLQSHPPEEDADDLVLRYWN